LLSGWHVQSDASLVQRVELNHVLAHLLTGVFFALLKRCLCKFGFILRTAYAPQECFCVLQQKFRIRIKFLSQHDAQS
jgi:hypothetical protein